MIHSVHCPSRKQRVEPDDCYERFLLGNCYAVERTPLNRVACRGCAVGRRNRARYAEEGDRIGWSERGWMQELRDAAIKNLLTCNTPQC